MAFPLRPFVHSFLFDFCYICFCLSCLFGAAQLQYGNDWSWTRGGPCTISNRLMKQIVYRVLVMLSPSHGSSGLVIVVSGGWIVFNKKLVKIKGWYGWVSKGKRTFDISKGEGGVVVGGLCPCATSFCLFCLMGVCLDTFLSFFLFFFHQHVCVYMSSPFSPFPSLIPVLSFFLSFLLMMLMILEPRHQRTHVDLGWVDVVLCFYFCFLSSSLAALNMEHWLVLGYGIR